METQFKIGEHVWFDRNYAGFLSGTVVDIHKTWIQIRDDAGRIIGAGINKIWKTQSEAIKYFLLLSELNTEVVIEMGGLDELLEMIIRDYNSKIINNYWTILEKECL